MTSTNSIEWFANFPVEAADEIKLEFAFNIDQAIVEQRSTRKEIAEKVGTSPAWITKVLRGDANLTIESMAKLADAVGKILSVELKNKAHIPQKTKADVLVLSSFRRDMVFKGGREAVFKVTREFDTQNDMELSDAA